MASLARSLAFDRSRYSPALTSQDVVGREAVGASGDERDGCTWLVLDVSWDVD